MAPASDGSSCRMNMGANVVTTGSRPPPDIPRRSGRHSNMCSNRGRHDHHSLLPSPPVAAVDAVRQIHGVLDRVDPSATAVTQAGAGEPGGGELSAQVAARGIAEVD